MCSQEVNNDRQIDYAARREDTLRRAGMTPVETITVNREDGLSKNSAFYNRFSSGETITVDTNIYNQEGIDWEGLNKRRNEFYQQMQAETEKYMSDIRDKYERPDEDYRIHYHHREYDVEGRAQAVADDFARRSEAFRAIKPEKLTELEEQFGDNPECKKILDAVKTAQESDLDDDTVLNGLQDEFKTIFSQMWENPVETAGYAVAAGLLAAAAPEIAAGMTIIIGGSAVLDFGYHAVDYLIHKDDPVKEKKYSENLGRAGANLLTSVVFKGGKGKVGNASNALVNSFDSLTRFAKYVKPSTSNAMNSRLVTNFTGAMDNRCVFGAIDSIGKNIRNIYNDTSLAITDYNYEGKNSWQA